MKVKVVIEPGEDGGYVVHVPALRGCWSQGKTRKAAIENVRKAIAGWLEAEQDKAKPGKKSGVELVSV